MGKAKKVLGLFLFTLVIVFALVFWRSSLEPADSIGVVASEKTVSPEKEKDLPPLSTDDRPRVTVSERKKHPQLLLEFVQFQVKDSGIGDGAPVPGAELEVHWQDSSLPEPNQSRTGICDHQGLIWMEVPLDLEVQASAHLNHLEGRASFPNLRPYFENGSAAPVFMKAGEGQLIVHFVGTDYPQPETSETLKFLAHPGDFGGNFASLAGSGSVNRLVKLSSGQDQTFRLTLPVPAPWHWSVQSSHLRILHSEELLPALQRGEKRELWIHEQDLSLPLGRIRIQPESDPSHEESGLQLLNLAWHPKDDGSEIALSSVGNWNGRQQWDAVEFWVREFDQGWIHYSGPQHQPGGVEITQNMWQKGMVSITLPLKKSDMVRFDAEGLREVSERRGIPIPNLEIYALCHRFQLKNQVKLSMSSGVPKEYWIRSHLGPHTHAFSVSGEYWPVSWPEGQLFGTARPQGLRAPIPIPLLVLSKGGHFYGASEIQIFVRDRFWDRIRLHSVAPSAHLFADISVPPQEPLRIQVKDARHLEASWNGLAGADSSIQFDLVAKP
ncbi:MAG: hypothetical protein DWQ01_07930 [Planctomycetota bacterium]|nr:MAG: hypothetical protein DWQ01_07930 [Planctomycetota bacterium]